MSEFEKELEKNMELNKVAYTKESLYSDFLVSKRDIERIFHDWQPPKPLVVVPRFIAEWLDNKSAYIIATSPIPKEVLMWSQENTGFRDVAVNLSNLIEIKVNGYTVEKEQMFILKHIDMSKFSKGESLYLSRSINDDVFGKYNHRRLPDDADVSKIDNCHFTQSEIDELNIGSYEKIEVDQ
ncbi:DUF1642 domain-containing protein [Lactococcus raffinolactis]|uniref:DUF1642 domain-containing protein n=1 Tax=Pseudolactococcus raffinolactis TaxID=1366 RepID=UPI001436786A|nr:DUF1642 domain-containing protein [Lactococcus raffinolactis]QIW50773.1 DUF1642 domain-containing protein [Lactococcus raffinolactis]